MAEPAHYIIAGKNESVSGGADHFETHNGPARCGGIESFSPRLGQTMRWKWSAQVRKRAKRTLRAQRRAEKGPKRREILGRPWPCRIHALRSRSVTLTTAPAPQMYS